MPAREKGDCMRSGARFLLAVASLAWPAAAGALPYAYISNSSGNSVSVIDTSTDSVVATIPVGYYPSDVAVTSDGTRAYAVNRSSNPNSVSAIDAALNAVTATVTVAY